MGNDVEVRLFKSGPFYRSKDNTVKVILAGQDPDANNEAWNAQLAAHADPSIQNLATNPNAILELIGLYWDNPEPYTQAFKEFLVDKEYKGLGLTLTLTKVAIDEKNATIHFKIKDKAFSLSIPLEQFLGQLKIDIKDGKESEFKKLGFEKVRLFTTTEKKEYELQASELVPYAIPNKDVAFVIKNTNAKIVLQGFNNSPGGGNRLSWDFLIQSVSNNIAYRLETNPEFILRLLKNKWYDVDSDYKTFSGFLEQKDHSILLVIENIIPPYESAKPDPNSEYVMQLRIEKDEEDPNPITIKFKASDLDGTTTNVDKLSDEDLFKNIKFTTVPFELQEAGKVILGEEIDKKDIPIYQSTEYSTVKLGAIQNKIGSISATKAAIEKFEDIKGKRNPIDAIASAKIEDDEWTEIKELATKLSQLIQSKEKEAGSDEDLDFMALLAKIDNPFDETSWREILEHYTERLAALREKNNAVLDIKDQFDLLVNKIFAFISDQNKNLESTKELIEENAEEVSGLENDIAELSDQKLEMFQKLALQLTTWHAEVDEAKTTIERYVGSVTEANEEILILQEVLGKENNTLAKLETKEIDQVKILKLQEELGKENSTLDKLKEKETNKEEIKILTDELEGLIEQRNSKSSELDAAKESKTVNLKKAEENNTTFGKSIVDQLGGQDNANPKASNDATLYELKKHYQNVTTKGKLNAVTEVEITRYALTFVHLDDQKTKEFKVKSRDKIEDELRGWKKTFYKVPLIGKFLKSQGDVKVMNFRNHLAAYLVNKLVKEYENFRHADGIKIESEDTITDDRINVIKITQEILTTLNNNKNHLLNLMNENKTRIIWNNHNNSILRIKSLVERLDENWKTHKESQLAIRGEVKALTGEIETLGQSFDELQASIESKETELGVLKKDNDAISEKEEIVRKKETELEAEKGKQQKSKEGAVSKQAEIARQKQAELEELKKSKEEALKKLAEAQYKHKTNIRLQKINRSELTKKASSNDEQIKERDAEREELQTESKSLQKICDTIDNHVRTASTHKEALTPKPPSRNSSRIDSATNSPRADKKKKKRKNKDVTIHDSDTNIQVYSRNKGNQGAGIQLQEIQHTLEKIKKKRAASLDIEQIHFPDALRDQLVEIADGDARRLLNLLELVIDVAACEEGVYQINEESLQLILAGSQLRRFDKGGEVFYDQISALHKSVRGSDPDAALYWFCRMIDGGCDPLYIARRVVRMATEDIGNADPRGLQLVINAWDVYERLGSPEGELAIAQAIIYLACAAKSNAVYVAYNNAMQDIKSQGSLEVPMHLRNAPTKLMKNLGYSKGYRYAHDEANAFAAGENYFPEGIGKPTYYHPVDRGLEIKIKQKLDSLRKLSKA